MLCYYIIKVMNTQNKSNSIKRNNHNNLQNLHGKPCGISDFSKVGDIIKIGAKKLKCKKSLKHLYKKTKRSSTLSNKKQQECYNKPCWHRLSIGNKLKKKGITFKNKHLSKKFKHIVTGGLTITSRIDSDKPNILVDYDAFTTHFKKNAKSQESLKEICVAFTNMFVDSQVIMITDQSQLKVTSHFKDTPFRKWTTKEELGDEERGKQGIYGGEGGGESSDLGKTTYTGTGKNFMQKTRMGGGARDNCILVTVGDIETTQYDNSPLDTFNEKIQGTGLCSENPSTIIINSIIGLRYLKYLLNPSTNHPKTNSDKSDEHLAKCIKKGTDPNLKKYYSQKSIGNNKHHLLLYLDNNEIGAIGSRKFNKICEDNEYNEDNAGTPSTTQQKEAAASNAQAEAQAKDKANAAYPKFNSIQTKSEQTKLDEEFKKNGKFDKQLILTYDEILDYYSRRTELKQEEIDLLRKVGEHYDQIMVDEDHNEQNLPSRFINNRDSVISEIFKEIPPPEKRWFFEKWF